MKRLLGGWVGEVGSLLLALILAITVWVTAVTSDNPDMVQVLERTAPVSVVGLGADLVAEGYGAVQPRLTIRAPQSVWAGLTAAQVSVTVDLTGLAEGTYTLPLRAEVRTQPAWVEKIEPGTVRVTVETLKRRTFSVRVEMNGSLAPGFDTGDPALTPDRVVVSGPASQVDRVVDVVASMSVDGLRSDFDAAVELTALDADGHVVAGVTIEPAVANLLLPIEQQGGYRDVVVKAVIIGSVKSGSRLTGLTVTPSVVTLYSEDPQIVLNMPGFVETEPLDISDAESDITRSLSLMLPPGVQVVGDSTVTVEVNISAIEDSLSLSRPIQFVGLGSNLSVALSPETVDVILSGPLSVLRDLLAADVDVFVDLAGLGPGSYTLAPVVQVRLGDVRVVSFTPGQIQVVITRSKSN